MTKGRVRQDSGLFIQEKTLHTLICICLIENYKQYYRDYFQRKTTIVEPNLEPQDGRFRKLLYGCFNT
jgi:hypothetical protein